MKKICIDFGHGGGTGARNGSIIEDDWINTAGEECVKLLKDAGFNVKCTRTENKFIELSERTKISNNFGSDLFVSIHFNAGGGTGFEAIRTVRDNVVTTAIVNNIIQKLHRINHVTRPRVLYTRIGTENKDYYSVLRGTKCPAMILEGAFIDNSYDIARFNTKDKLKALGMIYAESIAEYYGVTICSQNMQSDIIGDDTYKKVGIVKIDDSEKGLAIMSKPDENSKILSHLVQDDNIDLLYKCNDYWATTISNSLKDTGIGFVNSKYVQK